MFPNRNNRATFSKGNVLYHLYPPDVLSNNQLVFFFFKITFKIHGEIFEHLSGLKLTPYTGPLCPWRTLDSLAVFSSMILSSTSSDSLSIRFKSAEGEVVRARQNIVDGVSQKFQRSSRRFRGRPPEWYLQRT